MKPLVSTSMENLRKMWGQMVKQITLLFIFSSQLQPSTVDLLLIQALDCLVFFRTLLTATREAKEVKERSLAPVGLQSPQNKWKRVIGLHHGLNFLSSFSFFPIQPWSILRYWQSCFPCFISRVRTPCNDIQKKTLLTLHFPRRKWRL